MYPLHMRPSTSETVRPASASAASTASIAMSRASRPEAGVWTDSPTPTIATSPDRSARSEACPQLVSRRDMSARY